MFRHTDPFLYYFVQHKGERHMCSKLLQFYVLKKQWSWPKQNQFLLIQCSLHIIWNRSTQACLCMFVCLCTQVTLDCPGSEDAPHVDKLVERIYHCSCQSCSKEGAQEGAVMQLYPSDNGLDAPSLSDTLSAVQTYSLPQSDTHSNKHARPHTDHHTLPHTSDGG